MHKKYVKVLLNTLLILACVFFQRCTNQDTVAPQQDQVTANNDVLQKIKSLGFTENQIKETPNYYLADGDLYFSKKISSNTTPPAKKSGHRILEKYATLTIHVDESLAGVMDEHWRAGIDQAIAAWNAKEEVHFHFALTNSAEANINIVKDTDLPTDLAIASEFPRDGRTGSSIRINVAATKAVEDPKQAFAHALEHCMGFLHSTSVNDKRVKVNSSALTNARGPRFDRELYIVQDDGLWRVDANTGDYYPLKNSGWTGTELMGQTNGMLYVLQFGTLYAVNPSTGNHTPLTDGWEGSQYMTSTPGKLYIMQGSKIWPVDPDTGLWDDNIGTFPLPRGMVGFIDPFNNNEYNLAVLRRKPYSSVISLLDKINLSSYSYTETTVPASGVTNWNGHFFLAGSAYNFMIFNGNVNFSQGSSVSIVFRNKPNVEVVAGTGSNGSNRFYFISDATLYMIKHGSAPTAIDYGISQLGLTGDWLDTSCMVVLE